MYTGKYETELDKMALAVESTKIAKQMTVSEEGIGEDINMNIFCWKGDDLASIIQLQNTHSLDKDERLERITKAGCILRRGWGIDQYTFVAEGYCSLKPSDTKNKDLAKLFAEADSPVKECLSFTHLWEKKTLFVSVPYSVEVGKKVQFDSALWYSGLDVMRDLTYPASLIATLSLEPIVFDEDEVDRDVYFGTLAQGLIESGFEIFYRDDL